MTTFDLSGLKDGATAAGGNETDRHRIDIPPPPRRPRLVPTPATAVSVFDTPTDENEDPGAAAGTDTSSTPARARKRQRAATTRKTFKTTLRLYPDQPKLLGALAEHHGAYRTQILAAAITRYLDTVKVDGPIYRPPRRPKGPLVGEELRDYQINVDPTQWRQIQDVADHISAGDCSAVIRVILDRAATKAGLSLGARPTPDAGTVTYDI